MPLNKKPLRSPIVNVNDRRDPLGGEMNEGNPIKKPIAHIRELLRRKPKIK